MTIVQTRRSIVSTIAWAGAASLFHVRGSRADEGRLETTSLRLTKVTDMCMAPQFVAEELLRAEGFTDIQYVKIPIPEINRAIGSGKADPIAYAYRRAGAGARP